MNYNKLRAYFFFKSRQCIYDILGVADVHGSDGDHVASVVPYVHYNGENIAGIRRLTILK